MNAIRTDHIGDCTFPASGSCTCGAWLPWPTNLTVWDIDLDCDHKMLVAAPDEKTAMRIAEHEASDHARVLGAKEVPTLLPSILAWYPGPFSKDAIIDEGDH